MKKILFTTTTLVAATMIAGAANAHHSAEWHAKYGKKSTTSMSAKSVSSIESTRYLQQNDMMGASVLKATVGGYANWYMGYADNKSDTGVNEFDILGDAEVQFNIEAALKNGLKVGAKMELTTDTTAQNAEIDNTYMYVSGKMGKVVVGRHDNVSEQLSIHATDVGALDIQDTDFTNVVIGSVETYKVGTDVKASYFTEDTDNTKISYFTPNWKGLQAGVTYAPFGTTTQSNFDIKETADIALEATMISAVYESKFDQVGFAVSAGYGFVNYYDTDNPVDLEQFNIGARIMVKGFAIAAAYKSIDLEDTDNDKSVFDVGVSYETGPYAMSVSYLAGTVEASEDAESSTLLVSGKYRMAAGVDAFATLGFGDYDVITSPAGSPVVINNNDGWAIVGGMMLSF